MLLSKSVTENLVQILCVGRSVGAAGPRFSPEALVSFLQVARTVSTVLSRVVVCHRANGLEASQV